MKIKAAASHALKARKKEEQARSATVLSSGSGSLLRAAGAAGRVSDQMGAPTSVPAAGSALARLVVSRGRPGSESVDDRRVPREPRCKLCARPRAPPRCAAGCSHSRADRREKRALRLRRAAVRSEPGANDFTWNRRTCRYRRPHGCSQRRLRRDAACNCDRDAALFGTLTAPLSCSAPSGQQIRGPGG